MSPISTKHIKFFVWVLCCYMLLPTVLVYLPGNGLDASWELGLNMAKKQGLIFGRDVVFTYGPLGYLHTKLTVYLWTGSLYIFHLFLISNAFYILWLISGLLNWKQYIFPCILILVAGDLILSGVDMLLFIYFIFFSLFTLFQGSRFTLLLCSIIAIISFFIKLNTGILINLLFFVNLILLLLVNGGQNWIKTFIYFTLHTGVIILLAKFLNVDILGYIKGTMHLIGSFNDAMIIYPSDLSLIVALSSLSILFISFFVKPQYWFSDIKSFMLLLFVSIGTYIAFKTGYVRADQHVVVFFIYFPVFIGFLYLFSDLTSSKAILGVCFIFSLVISILTIQHLIPSRNIFSNLVKIPYINEWRNQKNYVQNMDHIFQQNLEQNSLPAEILTQIGSQSIDIIPWEISYAYYYQLHYNPRPVFQSYSAYHPYLDGLNVQKFLSTNAPECVLFHHYQAIEQYRNAFWDESQTKLAILRTYEPTAFHGEFLLMKRRPVRFELEEVSEKGFELSWNDTLHIKETDNLQYLYADMEYNLWGKLKRFFFQPNWNNVYVYIESQTIPKQYRAIIPIFKGGVLINREVSSNTDYFNFFNHHGQENLRINKIYFTTEKKWMKDKIKIKLKEFKLITQQ